MVLRVQEGGGSECRAVVVRIGGCAPAQDYPRETGQTSTWSLGAWTLGKPASRSKADDAGTSAGAASPNTHRPKGVVARNQGP